MTDLPQDTVTKIRDSFAAQNLMTLIGADITDLRHGFCQITAPIPDTMRQRRAMRRCPSCPTVTRF